jgi:hypothetical protein
MQGQYHGSILLKAEVWHAAAMGAVQSQRTTADSAIFISICNARCKANTMVTASCSRRMFDMQQQSPVGAVQPPHYNSWFSNLHQHLQCPMQGE